MKMNEIFELTLSKVLERKIENINPEAKPIDIEGWDSLTHIYLIMELESKLNIKFTTAQIQNWNCVGDIISDLISLSK